MMDENEKATNSPENISMKTSKQLTIVTGAGALIEELFDVDATALIDPGEGLKDHDPLAGLGRVLRQGLELALALGERRDVELHLMTNAQARALHWPDAASGNLGLLLAWGWLLAYRRRRSISAATLSGSRAWTADAAAEIDPRLRAMTIDALVARLLATPLAVAPGGVRGLEQHGSISIAARVRASLRLEPASFSLGDADDLLSGADDLDARARRGLEWLAMDVLEQFIAMRRAPAQAFRTPSDERAIAIRLRNSRAALVATVLAASLDAVARRDVDLGDD